MNYVWAVTFKCAEGAKKLLEKAEVKVKGQRCVLNDPFNQELRLKLHWLLPTVPDDEVRAAFLNYGRVTEIVRERWKVWERTSRTNLFRRVRDGGLGLSHLFPRQIVNRFCFLRDVKDHFLRTVLQLRLSKLVPDSVVSTECIEGSVFGFLKGVLMAYKFLRARFSCKYLAGVKRRKPYKDLVEILLPMPLYRTIYSANSGSDVLKRVKHMYVAPGAMSFFFRLHTGTVEVKTWLQEKEMYVPWGVHCFLCRKPETIEHVFLECWEGVFLWDILQRTLKKDLPLDPQGIRFLTVDNEEGVPFDAVMLLGSHCIWKACMAARHVDIDARSDVDARSAHEYFRESVGRFLEAHKSLDPIPEWVSRIEPLMNMRRF
nr:uncharacterized protein LOC119176923 [Rhipicephalus microplus]